MEQNINIAELLKDCPKGTKLYSPVCGECYLQDKRLDVKQPHIQLVPCVDGSPFILDEYGRSFFFPHGECLLFPSKDNRDWSTFKAPKKEQLKYAEEMDDDDEELESLAKNMWNKPKFKVGNVIRDRTGAMGIVKGLGEKGLIEIEYPYTNAKGFLLPVSLSSVTPEEIKGWNEKGLHPKHLHYSREKRKIVDWFLPFDKVLVRDSNREEWCAGFYSHYKVVNNHGLYFTTAGCACECIPYNEKTARLIGTTDDYKEE